MATSGISRAGPCVYAIRCIVNGKIYVGSAIDQTRRWQVHRLDLKKGKHHSQRLQNAWNKYGADAFEFSILEKIDDPQELLAAEQHWLDHFRSYEPKIGFNISPTAGSPLGCKRSDKSRKKSSEERKKLAVTDPRWVENTRRLVEAGRQYRMSKGHKINEGRKDSEERKRKRSIVGKWKPERYQKTSDSIKRAFAEKRLDPEWVVERSRTLTQGQKRRWVAYRARMAEGQMSLDL